MARVQPPDNQTSADGVEQILCPICHQFNVPRARYCQHCGRDIILNNDSGSGPTYRITRIIKAGGQGAVYEVIGEDNHSYAVKEMIERSLDEKEQVEALARFEFEASLLQSLSHPRVPKIYAHFKDEGRSYLAMDYVRGEDLEEILRRGSLPEERVLALADQVCDVLGYLHQKGLIYRDMKPSNIMVEPDGNVKLVDFGIAKVFQKASDRATQIGTPGYSPPEQYQGIATVESDIYALGATLHHMLTGRDPREEAPFSFPPVRNLAPLVSQRTAEAVERALKMKPEERFRSVGEFRAALRPLTLPTQQIRRAPATQIIQPPARTQATPITQATPAAPVAPVVPRTPPVIKRVPPQPVPQPAPIVAPTVAPKRGGFLAAVGRLIRSLLALAVVLVVLVVAGWYVLPGTIQPLLKPYLPNVITAMLPQPAPTPLPPMTSRQEQLTVEATVPSGADNAAVRSALIESYKAAVTAQFGAAARVNENIPISLIGDPQLITTAADGSQTYRAQVNGFVQRPATP